MTAAFLQMVFLPRALFLGREDALKLLEKYNAEAAFVDEDKNVYLTDGLKDRFELMKNTYTVKDAE